MTIGHRSSLEGMVTPKGRRETTRRVARWEEPQGRRQAQVRCVDGEVDARGRQEVDGLPQDQPLEVVATNGHANVETTSLVVYAFVEPSSYAR